MKTRVIQDDPAPATESPSPQGPPTVPRRSLAARMGHWSARHRKIAIFGWLAFVIAAFAIGSVVGTEKPDYATIAPGESGRAERILDAGFEQPASESVLIESQTLAAADAEFEAAVRDVVAALVSLDAVTNVRSPLDPANAGQIATDGHAAVVPFQIRGPADDAEAKIDPILDRIAQVQAAHPRLFVGQFGDTSANKALEAAFADDLKKAGAFSLPVTLIILVVAFGALVAAGIPLLLGLTAVIATLGLIAFPSRVLPIDESINAIVLLIGLAVGVDYSLFYLKREREERAAGRGEQAALEAAAATSGRSVLISGLTVMVAMAGMLLTGDKSFAAFGVATMIVVALAMVGSLTVLPAVLSKLGDNVDRLRVPFVDRLRPRDGEGRIWGAIVDRVLRRPVLALIAAGGLLVALAVPAFQLRIAEPGVETFPQGLPVVQTFNRVQAAFPGKEIPANLVVKAPDLTEARVQAAIAEVKRLALASGEMHEPILVDVNRDQTVAKIAIPIDGGGTDDASQAALATLRDEIVPTTIGTLPDTEYGVTGFTAQSVDSSELLKRAAPRVFGFVLVLAFALLLVAFRSLAIAIKAILLNLLSVAAAYGALVLVFQQGVGKGLLGFETTGGIVPFMPIFLFVILFGLSMDYHVFILSRVRECYDRGSTTEQAIAHGIKTTAGVVTSAAIVMVAVFSIFGTLSMIVFKQFGVGLAVAVFLDATIVRAVLLPATMKLLGDWNWYLPRWLEWLPHLEHGASAEPVEQAPALGPAT